MSEVTLTVGGQHFTLQLPYAAGHVIDVGEANALNSAYKDGVRNRFAPRLKALEQVGASQSAIEEEFREAAADFTFSANPGKRRSMDKVTELTRQLAEEYCRAAALRASVPIDWNNLTKDQQSALVVRAISLHPELREEAERRLSAIAELSSVLDNED